MKHHSLHRPSCLPHGNEAHRHSKTNNKCTSFMLSHGNGLFVAAILLFPSLGAFASETLDKIRFDIPEGFTVERGGDHIGFTRTDQQAGTYCQFGVYSSRPSNGPLKQEFFSEWQQILPGAPFDNASGMKNGTTRSGIEYMMGEQDVEKDGLSYYTRLYTSFRLIGLFLACC